MKDIAARTRSALATTPWFRKAKPAGAMGQMCSQPMGDDGHDIAIVSGQSRSTDATELSSGKTQRKNLTSVGRQTSGLVDNDSGPRVHKAAGAPAFGKRASTQWMAKEGSASLVEERMTPLKECTDEMIIAEVKLRNIKLHDRITKELVASKYTYGKILGQGSSASVYEAVHTKSKKKVAIKVIKRNDDINDDESMATELEILRTVRHRYILNCHELYESPQCIWVVMELIKGGELLDVLVERGLYSEADASRAMKQVLLAVRYLHSQGIVHRDLKLQNILLVSKEKDSDTKIGDFGLSAILPKDTYEPADREATKAYNKLADRWGTPQYFAPEMIRKAYGPQVDVWAIGIVLFQLLSGRLPFNADSNSALFRLIDRSDEQLRLHMQRPEWQGVSQPAKDLVLKLLERDPTKRLSAEEALNHPWIALRSEEGGAATGDLSTAYELLKKQVAQKRCVEMWHVLEIMNALEGAGATTNAKLVSKQLPPMLAAQASSVTALEMERREGSTGSMPPMSPHLVAPVTRQRAASKTDMVEELQGIFNLFDRDGNGTIDVDELEVLMKKLGYQPKREKLEQIIMEVDHNKDGELQFGEFCLFIKKIKEGGIHGGGYQEALAMQIDELSGSADGYVGAEDIKMMMQVFAETTGQTISEEDIQDILVLGHSAGHQGLSAKAVADAIMLDTQTRHEQARAKRETFSGGEAPFASLGGVKPASIELELPPKQPRAQMSQDV